MSKLSVPNKFPSVTDCELKYNGTTLWIVYNLDSGGIHDQVLKQRGIAPEIMSIEKDFIHIELNEIK